MTAPVTTALVPERIAARTSACGAPGCCRPIERGMRIVKLPGRAWQHAYCSDPQRGRSSQPHDELDRLIRTPSRMRPLPAPPALHQLATRRNDLAGTKPLPERDTR